MKEMAETIKALSEEIRLRLLVLLYNQGEGEVTGIHGVSGHRVPQVAASETAKRTSVREPARSPLSAVPCYRLPDELCVCELMGALNLPQSTISRHLAYLKKSGWVEGTRRGVWMHYRLSPCLTPWMSEILAALAREAAALADNQRDAANLALYRQNKKGDEECR